LRSVEKSVGLRVLAAPFRVLNRDLKLIFASNLAGSFGDGLYYFLLPIYMRTVLGADPVEVGILYTVMIMSATLTVFLGSFLADRYDRKKIAVLAWAIWIPVPLIFSYANDWIQLFPAMLLYGCMFSTPAVNAYIATAAHKEKVTLTFTTISAAWCSGYVFSPTIGGFIYQVLDMKIVFYLAFVFYTTATVILLFIRSQRARVSGSDSEKSGGKVDLKSMIFWVVFFAVIMFFNYVIRPFTPTFLEDAYGLDAFQVGVLGSFSFAGSALLGVLIGKIGDRWGNMKAISLCMLMTALSVGMLIHVNSLLALAPVFFLMGVNFTPWSLMNAIIGSTAPENIRGKWIGIAQTVSLLAAFIAPYVGGVLYEISLRAPFVTTFVGAIAISVFALLVSRRKLERTGLRVKK